MHMETAVIAARVTEFWRNVQTGRPDECWPWTGYAEEGYGLFFFEGRMRPAHELALTFTTGEVRLAELDTCHGCHNPPCCNPQHLRFDTRQSNVNDTVAAGRNHHPTPKITDDQVRLIRERRAAGAAQQDLAQQYGVSDAYISTIVNGKVRAAAGGPIATSRRYHRKAISCTSSS
jgi:hypothetical protein